MKKDIPTNNKIFEYQNPENMRRCTLLMNLVVYPFVYTSRYQRTTGDDGGHQTVEIYGVRDQGDSPVISIRSNFRTRNHGRL